MTIRNTHEQYNKCSRCTCTAAYELLSLVPDFCKIASTSSFGIVSSSATESTLPTSIDFICSASAFGTNSRVVFRTPLELVFSTPPPAALLCGERLADATLLVGDAEHSPLPDSPRDAVRSPTRGIEGLRTRIIVDFEEPSTGLPWSCLPCSSIAALRIVRCCKASEGLSLKVAREDEISNRRAMVPFGESSPLDMLFRGDSGREPFGESSFTNEARPLDE
mmetsp:Transcript_10835/g.29037  ORF Transcript_10835/g.29037 Transcript_10835/m.29037 type:complete len:221 (-) Transcript_10835:1092-1754(-)